MAGELQPTWGGPTGPTRAGVDLPACMLCQRVVKHTWAEHVAQVGAASDLLAKAAGLPSEAA